MIIEPLERHTTSKVGLTMAAATSSTKKLKASHTQPTGAYISHRGYAVPKNGNEELVQQLRDYLTVTPNVSPDLPNAKQPSFSVYRESDSTMYLPKYFGLSRFGVPPKNKVTKENKIAEAPGLIFNGTIRKEQEAPVNAFIEAANDPSKMGGIISIACGGGKTVIGLYLASVFKKRTLIVCHKEFLMNQWRERIQQFLPHARVGLIKQNKIDVEGRDIVIGSLQSLAMRDYDPEIFKTFGFVCYDEVHHCGAEVFSRSMAKITTPVTLGLSATLNRKDGLRKVFEWYIGKPVFQNQKRDDKNLCVEMHSYYDYNAAYGREIMMFNNKLNVAKMITTTCDYANRNKYIIDVLKRILKDEPDRRTLILSDRRGHLKELEMLLKDANLGSIGYYVGGMKEEQLKESEDKDIILATFAMAAEGMDIPCLNTLILASPVSAIEQPIGRVQRQKPHERKYTPLVIDIWDKFSIFQRQGAKRLAFYKKQGYSVIYNKDGKTGGSNEDNDDHDDDGDGDNNESHAVEYIASNLDAQTKSSTNGNGNGKSKPIPDFIDDHE